MTVYPRHDRVVVPDQETLAREGRRSFSLPEEVLEDLSLSIAEKRAILAEWASDRSAVESYPALRRLPGTTFPVTFSSILDARRKLDALANKEPEEVSLDSELDRVVFAHFARRSGKGNGIPH
jgi:hypothetical protein